MNRSEAKRLLDNLEFVKAFADGQDIQVRRYPDAEWENVIDSSFCSMSAEYRIKPRPIEGWANVYENGHTGLYPTKAKADASAWSGRIRCVFMREVEA